MIHTNFLDHSIHVRAIVATVILSGLVFWGAAQDALGVSIWQTRYKADGILVQTHPKENSAIPVFRAEIEIDANVNNVLAIIADPAKCSRWLYQCVEARTLRFVGSSEKYVYQVNELPWPLKNRDLVLSIIIEKAAPNQFRIRLVNKPNEIPEDQYIRIREFEGDYLLTGLSATRTKVEWEQHVEPGGEIPSMVIETMLTEIPVNSLKQLRKLAAELTTER